MEHKDEIRDYLYNKLSGEEKLLFEERLLKDATLQQEVTLYKNLYRIGKKDERMQFKKQLEGYDLKEKPAASTSYFTKWMVAAILIVALAVPSFLYFNNPSSEKLFAQNFVPYRNVIAPIERNDQAPQTIQQKAFEAYESKEYEKAILQFEKLTEADSTAYKHFYIGNSQLALGKTDAAIDSFKAYLQTNGSLKDRAQWYMALSYLADENKEMATPILENIVSTKSYNHLKASEILGKLD